jgi:hypothetical protein
MPDGKRILFSGHEAGHGVRCFVQGIYGGKPRPLTPEGVSACRVSPDAKWISGNDLAGNAVHLYPVDGGEPRPIPGLLPGETYEWTVDPKFIYVNDSRSIPIKIYRLNIETGRRQFFREMTPLDVSGLCDLTNIMLSADGRGYVYGYQRLLSDLYLVKGLR